MLSKCVMKRRKIRGTHVLVERLGAVVSEKPGGDGTHVDFFTTVRHVTQTADVLIIRGSRTNELG
jgi:hypothetical protein